MNVGGSVVVFVIAWWLAFQALLPVGVRSPAEEGRVLDGDPGAPVRGNLFVKGLWAAAIAGVVWGILFTLVEHSGLTFDDIPSIF
ncbi:MAG: DUF1467 family protein [Alphaproteobacteria bacterium]|jgi:predicted secreted protein